MTIYYFGNPLFSLDSMAPKVVETLKEQHADISFCHTDPTEQWWQGERNPILIDTVVGLDTVHLFRSLESFEDMPRRITPHDYDLLMDLSLLLKIKKIESFALIGLPEKGNITKIIQQVDALITHMNT